MFDTMTLVKVGGALCGTLLVFLLGGWAAETIYVGGGHHGDDHHAQGYVIEVASAEAAVEEEAVPFAEVLAAADPSKGEKVFKKCAACHKLDGTDGTGPHLNGVVNRNVGSVGGFGYSGNLKAAADVWTPENLNGFLTKPGSYAPGTTMGFAGLKKDTDRANLIAYLATTGG